MLKCIDGGCRKSCELAHSSCSHENPLRCADGRCVKVIQECVSARCNVDKPFLCPDGSCKATLGFCKYPNNTRVVLGRELTTRDSSMILNMHERNGKVVGTLYTNEQMHLRYKGVAMSQLEKTKLDIDATYEPVFYSYFSRPLNNIEPRDFIRSAVVSITTNSQDDKTKFKKAVYLSLETNIIKTLKSFGHVNKDVG